MAMSNHIPQVTSPPSFTEELKFIVERSGLTYRQIDENSYSQLYRAVVHGIMPSRKNLIKWCRELYRREAVSGQEADRLMNLAGYATPQQHEQALSDTAEQRAIEYKAPDTEPVQMYRHLPT